MPGASATAVDGIAVHRRSSVATVTIVREDRLNALDPPARIRLRQVLAELAEDARVGAVLVTGAGRAFSSGSDLSALAGSDSRTVLYAEYLPIVRSIRTMPKPVIAAVGGVASGAGAGLALACDLVIAGRSARFDLAFLRLGLVPDAGITWHLVRTIGRYRTAEVIWTAGSIDAGTAHAWSLVSRLVEPGRELAEARRQAAALAAGPREAIAASKRLMAAAATTDLWETMALEADAQGEMRRTRDHARLFAAIRGRSMSSDEGASR